MLTQEERTKQCIECGLCCKYIAIPTLNEYTYEVIDYYTKRGFPIFQENGKSTIHLYSPCPHLTDTGCNIYETRPVICRMSESVDEFGNCKVRNEINILNQKGV